MTQRWTNAGTTPTKSPPIPQGPLATIRDDRAPPAIDLNNPLSGGRVLIRGTSQIGGGDDSQWEHPIKFLMTPELTKNLGHRFDRISVERAVFIWMPQLKKLLIVSPLDMRVVKNEWSGITT